MKTNKRYKVNAVAAAPQPAHTPTNTSESPLLPRPEQLLEQAMNEPDRRILEDYTDVIRVLKDEKRFTFREIAHWLNGHGIRTDHNTIYRTYRKTLPPDRAEELDQETALEQNEQKG